MHLKFYLSKKVLRTYSIKVLTIQNNPFQSVNYGVLKVLKDKNVLYL